MKADDDLKQCTCGGELRFDPTRRGTTVGQREVEGGLVCTTCDRSYVCKASRPVEHWKLSPGGRSVDTGHTRVRAEAGHGVPELMTRIARVPDMERALRLIAAGAADAPRLAAAALAGGAP